MKDVWYRAFADYTPTNYGGGTDEFFCIKVEDENDAAQMKAADEEAIKLAKEWAAQGDDFADVGHVDIYELTDEGEELCYRYFHDLSCGYDLCNGRAEGLAAEYSREEFFAYVTDEKNGYIKGIVRQ